MLAHDRFAAETSTRTVGSSPDPATGSTDRVETRLALCSWARAHVSIFVVVTGGTFAAEVVVIAAGVGVVVFAAAVVAVVALTADSSPPAPPPRKQTQA